MSAYTTIKTKIKDKETLKKVLDQLKLPYEEGVNLTLYGYMGDRRTQTADIVVRKKYIGRASNDLGFKRLPDGTYEMIVSEFDRGAGLFSKGVKVERTIKQAEHSENLRAMEEARQK